MSDDLAAPYGEEHEVHVREHPLPGNARLFHVTLGDGTLVSVSTDGRSVDRSLSVTPAGSDNAVADIHLSGAEATTLAALLSGIRFVVTREADEQPVDAANLRTVTIPAASPVVGKRLHDIAVPDAENARVIAVIRDDTDDLIETDSGRPCQPGDRLVLVGRPGSMSTLVRHLIG
jgi:K+/H+ antiporter YhaU regulatory subunit KhtT